MDGAIGDKRAAPMLTNHQTKALKLLKGKAHRRAREAVAFRKVSLGRKHVARKELMLDLLAQNIDQLIV